MKKLLANFIILMLLIPVSLIGEDMTAEKVIENSFISYQNQIENIKDIKKITSKGTVYQKWIDKNGKTIYKSRREQETMGRKSTTIYDGKYLWSKDPVSGKVTKEKRNLNPLNFYETLKNNPKHIQYVGNEKINGHQTHKIKVKDVTSLKNSAFLPTKMEGWENESGSALLWIGNNKWILRKMQIDIKGKDKEGNQRQAKIATQFKDYRNIKGMLIPYHTISTIGMPSKSLTPEEKEKRKKAKQTMQKMQEEMEDMPPQQRKMMEKRMEKMKQFQDAFSKGEMTRETKVKEVKINTGLPDNLFKGQSLKQ